MAAAEPGAEPGAEHGEARGFRLTPLTVAQVPVLEPMVRAYYREDGHTYRDAEQLAALVALAGGDPLGRAWLIEVEGRVVGYVVLTLGFSIEAGGTEGCIDEFFLVPEARNRGLGRSVLEQVETEARQLGIRRLFLEVERHNRALALYERAGYTDHDRHLLSKRLAR